MDVLTDSIQGLESFDTVALHRVGDGIQFVFDHRYDRNIGLHPTNGNSVRLGPPKIVSIVSTIILDIETALALRDCIERFGDFVEWDFRDRRGGYIRVRQSGDPFADKPEFVSLTLFQNTIPVCSLAFDVARKDAFVRLLDAELTKC